MVYETVLGDMPIQDLTPKSTNIGERIVKNMRICGSGIYDYDISEAPLLGLEPVPGDYRDLQTISVYRPPEVLQKYKDYFARIPIITGHHVKVDRDNAKDLAVGMVGDTVKCEVDQNDGETYLYTTGTIIAGDGIDAYEEYGQLSVGYVPKIEWEAGTHKGRPYQAVLKSFEDVNHLLICKVARGGPQCMVMDSKSSLQDFVNKHGGDKMGLFRKIFGSKIAGDSAVVVTLLQSVAAGADPKTQVGRVKSIVGDSDSTLNGYLDELANAKGEDPRIVAKAVGIVEDYYINNCMGDACTCSGADKASDDKDKKVEGDSDDKDDKDKKVEGDSDDKDKAKSDNEDAAGDTPPCNGDSQTKPVGDSIDYEKLAELVAQKLNGNIAKSNDVLGDTAPLMAGITGSMLKSSDDLMKQVWGK